MSSSLSALGIAPSVGELDVLQEHLCYVHCNFCDTVLIVSVPSNSLFKTVAVRCGHCTNLISANMCALLFPTFSPPAALNAVQHFSPTSLFSSPHGLMEEIGNSVPSSLNNNHVQAPSFNDQSNISNNQTVDHRPGFHKTPPINQSPEKKQRIPSAYNRFIKEEIQRIKAVNPNISHREAFSTAAKNWAHFPRIQFGVHHKQDGEQNVLRKEVFRASAANFNVRVTPY